MVNHDFITSQVERELVNAFRTIDETTRSMILRFAQNQVAERAEQNKKKIRLVASAGRRTE